MFSIKHVAQYRYLCLHGKTIAIAGAADGVSLDDVTESLTRATANLNCASVPGSVGQGEAVVGWISADDAPCEMAYGFGDNRGALFHAAGVSPLSTVISLEDAVTQSLAASDMATAEHIASAMKDLAATVLESRPDMWTVKLSYVAALRIECAAAGQWFLVALCDLSWTQDRPLPSVYEDAIIAGDMMAPPRREDIDTSKLTEDERAKLARFTPRMAMMACLSGMRATDARLSSAY